MADVVTNLYIETTAGVWSDVTDDLISGTITRGRQNQLDRVQAGTCELLLDNDDRKFDPTFAASPLTGHIVPMKRVKLTGTYAAVTYPLFLGYADRWTQNRPGPHRGTTTLTATDGFKVLERARLASSGYVQEVLADDPVALWRLDEADGATIVRDSVGAVDLDVLGTPSFGETSLVSRDPGGAVLVTGDGTQAISAVTPHLPLTGPPITLELVYRRTAAGSDGALIGQYSGTAGALYLSTTSTGTILLVGFNGSGATTVALSTGVDLDDALPHHIVGIWEAGGNLKIYVDGVDRTSGAPTLAAVAFTATSGRVFVAGTPPGNVEFPDDGTYQLAAFYNTALSAARIAVHAAAVATPWSGDLPGARIGRVLDAVGWPAADRNIDAGQTTLQSAELNMTALEHLQKVAETEPGALYVTAAGVVRFEDRNSAVNQPVAFAFSDAAGAGKWITFSNPEISDEDIRNDVTVSRLEGAAQTVSDAASIAAYQTSSYVRDGLYNADDAHSRYLAQLILEGYKDPVERVSNMAVNPYRDPDSLWPAVLGLELTDRVTLTETPQWVTPAVTRTLVVEGISHSFAAKAWGASFNLSENTASAQAYWQLGVAGYSELGETTRLYF